VPEWDHGTSTMRRPKPKIGLSSREKIIFKISSTESKKLLISYYSITPWSRVLLEKLTSPQLVKKFLAFCGTRRFITAFTRTRHLSLS
jgi:hypothetical protein